MNSIKTRMYTQNISAIFEFHAWTRKFLGHSRICTQETIPCMFVRVESHAHERDLSDFFKTCTIRQTFSSRKYLRVKFLRGRTRISTREYTHRHNLRWDTWLKNVEENLRIHAPKTNIREHAHSRPRIHTQVFAFSLLNILFHAKYVIFHRYSQVHARCWSS
jgi:hypothetical protein